MDCSKIMMTTTASTAVAANTIIPLANIERRTGQSLQGNANSIIVNRPGYYKISGTVTFTAPAAGNVVIALTKGGNLVNGITTASTVTTATTEINTLAFTGLVRVFPGDVATQLNLRNLGVAITTSNVNLVVEAV